MGEKALAYLLRHEWRHLPRWKDMIAQIKLNEPVPKDPRGTIESLIADTEFMKADEKFRREFMKTTIIKKFLIKKCLRHWKHLLSLEIFTLLRCIWG